MNPDNPNFRTPEEERRAEELVKAQERIRELEIENARLSDEVDRVNTLRAENFKTGAEQYQKLNDDYNKLILAHETLYQNHMKAKAALGKGDGE